MGAPIPLRELSVFTRPPGHSLMAVLKGYFDDSQTDRMVWAIGGYIGDQSGWGHFDTYWPMALANHNVPYFHMKEMARPNGVYAKWHPPQEHDAERADFFAGLAKVIKRSNLTGFCSMVRLEDLGRFNAENRLALHPYPLAAYGCMLLVARHYSVFGVPVEMVFDHLEKVHSKLAKAREYADTDSKHSELFGNIVTVPLPEKLTFKEVPAIQAADFFTWEMRKTHVGVAEWFASDDRLTGKRSEWWPNFKKWSLDKFGEDYPPQRKSADALIQGEYFDLLIWDTKNLHEAHEVRRGVWP